MKKIGYALLACLFLAGCGSKKSDSATGKIPVNKKVHPVVVKYPMAIVIEGGLAGDLFTGEGVTPLWRMYACLEKSEVEQSGRIKVDFGQMGQPVPILRSLLTENGQQVESISVFKDFLFTYKFQVSLDNYPAMPNNAAHAEGNIEYLSHFFDNSQGLSFGETVPKGAPSWGKFANIFETLDKEQDVYFRTWIERFNANPEQANLILPCENKPADNINREIFFRGDELKSLKPAPKVTSVSKNKIGNLKQTTYE